MIISGGSRKNWRYFAAHMMKTLDNERVTVAEIDGVGGNTVYAAFHEMADVADGTRCKNFLYHVAVNPRENEELDEAQWERARAILEKHLGLENQPCVVVEHDKEGRKHRHFFWSRIDVDTMTARSDSLTYRKHELAAREMEKEFGLEPVASVLVKDRDGPRPERRPKNADMMRGKEAGLSPEQVKKKVTVLWLEHETGAQLREALAKNGYILCQGDRVPFCIVDPSGTDHNLVRRIEGVKAKEVYARLADIDRETLPTVQEAKETANGFTGTSDAARTVQEAAMNKALRAEKLAGVQRKHEYEREGWVDPRWSPLEKTAQQYGKGVRAVADVGQDVYRRIKDGVREQTAADEWANRMWGEAGKEPDGTDRER